MLAGNRKAAVKARSGYVTFKLTHYPPAGPMTRASLDALATNFHEKHHQTYGHANTEEPVQLVTLRVTAVGQLPELRLGQPPTPGRPARQRVREVWFHETGFVATPVHWRDDLIADQSILGPAIIEALDSTIVVLPGWLASTDAGGYIRLRRR